MIAQLPAQILRRDPIEIIGALIFGGTAAIVGVLAGIEPQLAIAGALGLIFVVIVLADLAWGLALFSFLTFVALMPLNAGPALSVVKAAGLMLALSWLASVTTRTHAKSDFFRENSALSVLVLGLLAWIILSQVWASDAAEVRSFFSRLALNAILFVIVFSAVGGERDLRLLLMALVVGSTASAVVGIVQSPDPGAAERLAGTLGNPNELAAVLVVGAVLAVGYAAATPRSPLVRLFAILCGALCLLGVLMTLSRAGLLALATVAVSSVFLAGRWRGRFAVAGVIAACLAVFYIQFVIPPEARERVLSGGGGTGRVDLWTVGYRMIEDKPVLGVGAGNFPITSIDYLLEPGLLTRSDFIVSDPKVAHNTYIEMFAELGIVGFLLFCGMILACLVYAWRAARIFEREGRLQMEILTRAVLIGLLGLLAADFFQSAQFQKALWLLLAVCPCLYAMARNPATETIGTGAS